MDRCRGVLVWPQGDNHSNYNPFPSSLRFATVNPLAVLRPGVLVCSPGVFHGFSEASSALPQKKDSIPWRRRGTCSTSVLIALPSLSFDDINPTTLELFSSEPVAVAALS